MGGFSTIVRPRRIPMYLPHSPFDPSAAATFRAGKFRAGYSERPAEGSSDATVYGARPHSSLIY
jgi:hypothetical protein